MRALILADGAVNGITAYKILTKEDHVDQWNRLQSLLPRIKAMASRELGEDFIGLDNLGVMLSLNVKAGTSTRKRFQLRDLLGWITLFDTEEPQT
jgi:hypothetical protein